MRLAEAACVERSDVSALSVSVSIGSRSLTTFSAIATTLRKTNISDSSHVS